MSLRLRVNGRERIVEAPESTPLLSVLRNDLGLSGPKFGCGLGQCGACTVLVDGEPVRSCVRAAGALGPDVEVVTLEGLGDASRPHPPCPAHIPQLMTQMSWAVNSVLHMGAAPLVECNGLETVALWRAERASRQPPARAAS